MAIEFKFLRLRRGTAGSWTAGNPVLQVGEPGYDSTTGRVKIGDGVTAWSAITRWLATNVDIAAVASSLTNYVLKAGDTMTGNLTVTKPGGWPLIAVDAAAGQLAGFVLRRGGKDRWALQIVPDPETGGNVASNLDFMRCDDAGNAIGIAARWDRASGILDIGAGVLTATPAVGDDGRRTATTEWVRNTIPGRPVASGIVSLPAADTYLAGKAIAAGELTTTTRYRITIMMNKTATAANTTITVRYGTAGTTADTLIAQLALVGTAAADAGIVQCEVAITSISSTTGTIVAGIAISRGATVSTGFNNQAGGATVGSVATLNTTAARTIGVSIASTVNAAVGVFSVVIQKVSA